MDPGPGQPENSANKFPPKLLIATDFCSHLWDLSDCILALLFQRWWPCYNNKSRLHHNYCHYYIKNKVVILYNSAFKIKTQSVDLYVNFEDITSGYSCKCEYCCKQNLNTGIAMQNFEPFISKWSWPLASAIACSIAVIAEIDSFVRGVAVALMMLEELQQLKFSLDFLSRLKTEFPQADLSIVCKSIDCFVTSLFGCSRSMYIDQMINWNK